MCSSYSSINAMRMYSTECLSMITKALPEGNEDISVWQFMCGSIIISVALCENTSLQEWIVISQ